MLKYKAKACFLGLSTDSLAATQFPSSSTSHLGSFGHCAMDLGSPTLCLAQVLPQHRIGICTICCGPSCAEESVSVGEATRDVA